MHLCCCVLPESLFLLSLRKILSMMYFLKYGTNKCFCYQNQRLKIYCLLLVRNACIDHLRRISLEQEFADKRAIQLKLDELSFYDGADELFMRKDLMAHVMAKINELPEKRREIFLLSYMEGLKAAEIAERLNLSTRTVENQLYRTLLFLRKELQTAFVYLFMFV